MVEITAQIDAYFEKFPDASNLRKGNKMARERMTILYDHSAAEGALVVGTSNKTELLLGYGTLFGDMASAVNPIGDLFKTQVRQLSRYLKVPGEVIEKAPSADLWVGQTDEEELGLTYAEADRLVRVESAVPGLSPETRWQLGKAQYLFLKDNARSFEDAGLYVYNVKTLDGEATGGEGAQRHPEGWCAAAVEADVQVVGCEAGHGGDGATDQHLGRALGIQVVL